MKTKRKESTKNTLTDDLVTLFGKCLALQLCDHLTTLVSSVLWKNCDEETKLAHIECHNHSIGSEGIS